MNDDNDSSITLAASIVAMNCTLSNIERDTQADGQARLFYL